MVKISIWNFREPWKSVMEEIQPLLVNQKRKGIPHQCQPAENLSATALSWALFCNKRVAV